ncbi:MAG: hypothetical protein IH600_11890 [Bacteroidetes bacterium]|nr:hypothetical protein [Bacteroidota bacterium]
MLKKAVSSLVILPFVMGMAFAQGPHTATTLVCSTSDGTVRISDQRVTLADYDLQFDSMVQEGVLRFIDTRSSATAILDARDNEGLYLVVNEGGQTMQVVAARTDIRYEPTDRGSEPVAPSLSSVLHLLRGSSERK